MQDPFVPDPTAPAARLRDRDRVPLVLLVCLPILLLWDAGGLDLQVTRLFGSAQGFALRDHMLLTTVMHEGARTLSWAVTAWLVLGIAFPTGLQRRLARADRIRWAVATLLAATAVSLIKAVSWTSCPWDLAEFGGVAQYISHWQLGLRDGGSGHCFPAGHAAAGFAHLAGWFALRHHAPRAARWWLAAALLAGLALGLAQQLRGAHHLSHTLWSAWVCTVVVWSVDRLRFERARSALLSLRGRS